MAGKMQSAVFLAATMAVVFAGVCSAATYNVGDATNWTDRNLPNTTFYSAWASQHKFQVGDVLVFTFPANFHTVATVSKSSYDSCSTTNVISLATTPPVRITLNTTGTHYFICTMPTHCQQYGQKLAVTVSAASGPSSSPAPQTSPSTTTTPPPTTSSTTPGPASSTQSPPLPTTPAPSSPAGGSTTTPPQAGSFAAPTAASFGLLSLVSMAAAALLF